MFSPHGDEATPTTSFPDLKTHGVVSTFHERWRPQVMDNVFGIAGSKYIYICVWTKHISNAKCLMMNIVCESEIDWNTDPNPDPRTHKNKKYTNLRSCKTKASASLSRQLRVRGSDRYLSGIEGSLRSQGSWKKKPVLKWLFQGNAWTLGWAHNVRISKRAVGILDWICSSFLRWPEQWF